MGSSAMMSVCFCQYEILLKQQLHFLVWCTLSVKTFLGFKLQTKNVLYKCREAPILLAIDTRESRLGL